MFILENVEEPWRNFSDPQERPGTLHPIELKSLTLDGFRSYDHLELRFPGSGIDLLLGANGAGKTNIIEALEFLSFGRSCLGIASEDAVRFGAMAFKITAEMATDKGELSSLEYVFQVHPKRARAFFVRGVKVPFSAFVGNFTSMAFLPQDLELFTRGPERRRAFLDELIARMYPQYVKLRLLYDRTLKQRNALLKAIAYGETTREALAPWDSALSQHGAKIEVFRSQVLVDLEPLLRSWSKELHTPWSVLSLENVRTVRGTSEEEIATSFAELLRSSQEDDIRIGSTSIGPHRDDWRLLIDERPLHIIASRGQQRTVFLALVFAATQLIEQVLSDRPVILLDDVFSELDADHQEFLLHALKDHHVLITSTSAPATLGNRARCWDIADYKVVQRS